MDGSRYTKAAEQAKALAACLEALRGLDGALCRKQMICDLWLVETGRVLDMHQGFPGIHEVGFCVRTRNILARHFGAEGGLDSPTLGDVAKLTERELLRMKDCGKTSLHEVRLALEAHGLGLQQ